MRKKQPKAPGWGGARPGCGRRRKKEDERTEQISTRVPVSVIETLKAAAAEEEISLSLQAAEVLTDWAAAQTAEPEEEPQPEFLDARTQALNRLADALEKIVERINPDKE